MIAYSTLNLDGFYEPEHLKRILLYMGTLETLLTSFEPAFIYRKNINPSMDRACIANGFGDCLEVIFSPHGTIIQGFAHESPVSPYSRDDHSVWPGIYTSTPKVLLDLLTSKDDVTFCIWREPSDPSWRTGDLHFPNDVDDGSSELLAWILPTADDFLEWEAYVHESDIDPALVRKVYAGHSLDDQDLKLIVSDGRIDKVRDELRTLGMYHS